MFCVHRTLDPSSLRMHDAEVRQQRRVTHTYNRHVFIRILLSGPCPLDQAPLPEPGRRQ